MSEKTEKNYCPKCGKTHIFFTNPPSWKNKQAFPCGEWFTQAGKHIPSKTKGAVNQQ